MAEKISNSQKRLIELMDTLHVSQSDIAKKSGLGRSTICNYVKGNREPNQRNIAKIADAYNLSPAWLMGYSTSMFISDVNDLVTSKMIEMESTPFVYKSGDEEYVLDIQKLNPDGRQALKNFFEFLLQNRDYRKEDN